MNNKTMKRRGETYLRKVESYIGEVYQDKYMIISSTFKYAGDTENQNRTYFIMENIETGEICEKYATRVIKYFKTKNANKNKDNKDLIESYENRITILNNKLNESEMKINELTDKLNKKNVGIFKNMFNKFIGR